MIRNIILFCSLAFCQVAWSGVITVTQDVLVGRSLIGIKDYDPTDFYLPSDDQQKSPVLVFLQGGKVDKKHYSEFAKSLAAQGVVVGIANHDSVLGKNFTSQRVLTGVWQHLLTQSSQQGSVFFERIDRQKLFVMGHSFGGTAVSNFLENTCTLPVCIGRIERPNELLGGIFFGFHRVGKSIQAGIPVHWVQGSLDNLAEAQETFDDVVGEKSFTVIEGANHFGITNENNPEGAVKDDVIPELSQQESIGMIAESVLGFIKSRRQ